MKKLMLGLMLGILLIVLVSAEVPVFIFEQSKCVELIQTCPDCSYVNITSITYPNSTQAVGEVSMTKQGTNYNYSFCLTSILGRYVVNGVGDEGGVDAVWAYDFEITSYGKEKPSGIVIVTFSILFLIILLYLIFFLFEGIGHFKEFDFDIRDLALNWGGYFALFATYMLEKAYMGNLDIESFLILFIEIGALTNFLLPLIAFIISYIKQNMKTGDHN